MEEATGALIRDADEKSILRPSGLQDVQVQGAGGGGQPVVVGDEGFRIVSTRQGRGEVDRVQRAQVARSDAAGQPLDRLVELDQRNVLSSPSNRDRRPFETPARVAIRWHSTPGMTLEIRSGQRARTRSSSGRSGSGSTSLRSAEEST